MADDLKIPTNKEATLRCLCCGKEIQYLDNDHEAECHQANLNDGISSLICGGYGSNLDTVAFVIAICDRCTVKAISEDKLLVVGCYPPFLNGKSGEEIKQAILKSQ